MLDDYSYSRRRRRMAPSEDFDLEDEEEASTDTEKPLVWMNMNPYQLYLLKYAQVSTIFMITK